MMPSMRHTVKRFTYAIILALLCMFMLMPIVLAVTTSLKPLDEVYKFPPKLTIENVQWSNYHEALTKLPLGRFLANSLFITLISGIGAVLTASMAGFALARLRFRARRLTFILVIVSLWIPAYVLLVPRFLLFDWMGWVNTYKPLIVPAWLGGGAFNVLLFRQFFRTIPRDFDQAASLDGATVWQTYWHILLPMVKPATITAGLLSFVYHWQDFLDPLIYLSDFSTYPVSLGLRMYQSMAGTWANVLMAASLIALIPIVVVFVFCERHVMNSLGVIRSDQNDKLPPLPRGD